MATQTVAVTGATGFVGYALCAALVGQNRPVRALVRSPERAAGLPGEVERVAGSIHDERVLAALMDGAGTVIHAAGIVAARRPEDFHRVNAEGTAQLLAAAASAASPPRILLVSSLAARRPDVSAYAASKRAAERAVVEAGLEHLVVRPPAVYGPGDRATLPLFKQLSRGLLLVPRVPGGRFSLLHVDDLARLFCALLDRPAWASEVLEPDDGRACGYSWRELAGIAGQALGRTVRCIEVPRAIVWCAALAEEVGAAVRGGVPMLSRGKLSELWYPDWVCNSESMRDVAGWAPQLDFAEGFRRTLRWYRDQRWI